MSGQMMMQVFKQAFERYKKHAQSSLRLFINKGTGRRNVHGNLRLENMR